LDKTDFLRVTAIFCQTPILSLFQLRHPASWMSYPFPGIPILQRHQKVCSWQGTPLEYTSISVCRLRMIRTQQARKFSQFRIQISLRRFAISIAARAASNPLLPPFVPARSIACSMLSVVKTPKITGVPVSRPT
jgi:hypothetical protein